MLLCVYLYTYIQIAAAYATWGPYHGLRANLPYYQLDVHPDEFSMTYAMVGYTLDPNYRGSKGADPPKTLENQIMAGLVVSNKAEKWLASPILPAV